MPEAGEAEVTCPVVYDSETTDIAFNPQFLIDALKVVDSDEVSFEMSAGNKPAMIKADGDVNVSQDLLRTLNLTETGRSFYEHSSPILAVLEEAESAVAQEHGELRGGLRPLQARDRRYRPGRRLGYCSWT